MVLVDEGGRELARGSALELVLRLVDSGAVGPQGCCTVLEALSSSLRESLRAAQRRQAPQLRLVLPPEWEAEAVKQGMGGPPPGWTPENDANWRPVLVSEQDEPA